MVKSVFVTGTDTGVGKTVVTGLLARFMAGNGINVVTQKWVETGCRGEFEDVSTHMRYMGKGKDHFLGYFTDMTPYVFGMAASPHLAARVEDKRIDPAVIEVSFKRLRQQFESVIVEGVGGILVPINEKSTIADIVWWLDLPVLIVAENRLGAINQCILTIEALKRRGIGVLGVIFNRLSRDNDEVIMKDNLDIVGRMTGEEVFGDLPYCEDMDKLYKAFEPAGERITEKLMGKE